jgi:hypothetical protein
LSVVRLFAVQHLANKAGMQDFVAAFLAICTVTDALFDIPFGNITAAHLKLLIETFIDLFIIAGWRDFAHPKFHWLLHLWQHLAKWGFLPNCFVTERKHMAVKRCAQTIRNTTTYQDSVLRDVTAMHKAIVQRRGEFDVAVGLMNPVAASQRWHGFAEQELGMRFNVCQTARYARYGIRGTCSINDVVLARSMDGTFPGFRAAEIWAHSEVDGVTISLVDVFSLVHWDREHGFAVWQKQGVGAAELIPTDEIVCTCIHRTYADGTVDTLWPQFVQ